MKRGKMADTKTYYEILKAAIQEFSDLKGDAYCNHHLAFDFECFDCCNELAQKVTIEALSAPDFDVKMAWINLAIRIGERGEELIYFYSNLMQN